MIMSANECIRNQASLSGYVIGPLYDNMWHSFKEGRVFIYQSFRFNRISCRETAYKIL